MLYSNLQHFYMGGPSLLPFSWAVLELSRDVDLELSDSNIFHPLLRRACQREDRVSRVECAFPQPVSVRACQLALISYGFRELPCRIDRDR